jgi:DNA (cytosine-5)-methyltransferase 1
MFVQMDAIDFVNQFAHKFDVIHASPPCQRYSTLGKGNNANSDKYPDLLAPTRDAIAATGKPYVIENVPSAPLVNPIMLCGEMFGLRVIRHRLFESNVLLMQPEHLPHRGRVAGWRHGEKFDGPWCQTKLEIAEAIPPAYTEFIGSQLDVARG